MRAVVIAVIATLILTGWTCSPQPKTIAPIADSYHRGVNSTTFLWFESYGDRAGNESAASYAFLAAQGISVVRLPILWERIQPELGSDLATDEVERLRTEVRQAHAAGIGVIVDLHNFCRYRKPDGHFAVCSRGIGVDQFAGVWTRLSVVLNDEPGVLAYDLMNEPHELTAEGSNTRADAEVWEQFSQAAVDAIRAAGDDHLLVIEGSKWSNIDRFGDLHPTAWITDPLDKVVYSPHQYFNQSGRYELDGQDAPELRYSYWSRRLEADGSTGGKPFDEWNVRRLEDFIDWLTRNKVRGDIGEIGWPSYQAIVASGVSPADASAEARQWNTLAEKWFRVADAAGLSVTYWAASGIQFIQYPGSPPGVPEPNAVYVHGAGNGELRDSHDIPILSPDGDFQPRDLDAANSQHEVLARRR